MTAFKTKKLQIETLGEYLQDARKRMRLTREQVSRLTQIPIRSLQRLEESIYEGLPADVYVKGFLKSLAAVYEAPSQVLIDQFEQERGLDEIIKPGSSEKNIKYSPPQFTITPKTLTLTFVFFLSIVAVGYLVWQVRSVSAAPPLEIITPFEDTSIFSRSILLRGKTEAGARVYINEQEILVEESGDFQQVLNLAEGTNQLLIKAQNKFEKSTEVKRVIVVSPLDVKTDDSEGVLDHNIIVVVSVGPQDAWIEVQADEEVFLGETIPAGEKKVFVADTELLLSTGNAGSTRVVYNGQDLGVLGRPGEVLSGIRFSR